MNLLNKIILSGVLLSSSATAEIVAHWTLDNSLQDISGNGYHLLQSQNDNGADVVFSPETQAGSIYSQSAYFSSGAHLATPLSSTEAGIREGFSFSFWFNYDHENRVSAGWAATGYDPADWAFLDFDRSENFMVAPTVDGRIQFSMSTTNAMYDYYSDSSLVNDGGWHHLFGSYGQNDGLSIYLDGMVIIQDSFRGLLKEEMRTRYGLLGQGSEADVVDGTHNGLGYTGYLSDVTLWNNEVDDHAMAASSLLSGGNYYDINEIEYIREVPVPALGLSLFGLFFCRRKR